MTSIDPYRASSRHTPRAAAPKVNISGVTPQAKLHGLMITSSALFFMAIGGAALAAANATTSDAAFRTPALYMAGGIGLLLWTEAQAGLRNLVRVDIFMILVLFLLTFFEFILPQDTINMVITLEAAQTAVFAALIGFAGIIIGRHAFPPKQGMPQVVNLAPMPGITMALLLFCAFFGYLYMLLAVNFDIDELIFQMQRPRFTQPWTRGRVGGLSTLLNELGLLKYLIPPLGAAILAQGRHYNIIQKTIAIILVGFVLFEGFAGGTRNVFLIHIITFATTYALLMRKLTLFRLTLLMAPLLAISFFAIVYLPEIRTIGLENFELEESRTEQLFVDMNLVNIALLTEVFPKYVPFLGFEVPYIAAIRPIPRAVWSGKPEGLSLGIEEALGVEGLTLSATFIGETWMAGGYLGVLLCAIAFGAAAALWNRRGSRQIKTINMIVFAIGFFPAGIAMRSLMSSAPTILPVFFLLVALRFLKVRNE